ncbi:hypothetical protein HYV89_02905 [Candidatus Woesearchaeota archaeon]|nr:hypothetical protein [Candidatus Woesearchaeota archaeon]
MFTKRGFALILLIFLLGVDAYAQSFGFDFQYGRRASGFGARSGVSNAISSALDLILGGIVNPIFDSIKFNFYGATRLALWIILYLIFANVFKKFFSGKGMHDKFSKIIAAILALFSVAFIPERLLDLVFRDLLGGLIGFLLLAAAVGLPSYFLYKWSKDHPEDRAVNLVSALLFFLLLIVFTELHDQFVNALNYGFVQSVTSLMVIFAIIFALIMMIHRLYMGFKKKDGEAEVREEGPAEERDELGNIRETVRNTISLSNEIIEQLHNTGNTPAALAYELTGNPSRLNFINRHNMHELHKNALVINRALDSVKGKKKKRAREISARITQQYNHLHNAIVNYSNHRSAIHTQIQNCRHCPVYSPNDARPFSQWFRGHHSLFNFFTNIAGILRNIEMGFQNFVKALSELDSV